jgi:uncharacterized membrane protein YeaQ/YmgE (transglycosylase-associated protein family)
MHIYSVYISQSFVAWLLIGLIAGWLAGKVSRGRGFGGFIYSIAAATIGAIVLVAIARLFAGGPN